MVKNIISINSRFYGKTSFEDIEILYNSIKNLDNSNRSYKDNLSSVYSNIKESLEIVKKILQRFLSMEEEEKKIWPYIKKNAN